jgi:hypothetical protein
MGQVFLGVSPGGWKVAVKVIRAEHASSPQFRARFAREVQAAQRVGGFPEQVRGERAEPASDVFSLGCVLIFAATGQGPFDAATIPAIVHRIINEEPRLGGITGDLRALVGACLAKTPSDRPGGEEILTHLATRATPTDTAQTTPPSGSAGRPAIAWPAQPPPAPTATSTRSLTDADGAGPVAPTQAAAPTPTSFPRRTLILGTLGTAGLAALAYPIVRVLEPDNPPVATLAGHRNDVFAVAFSPDGKTLASGSSDNTARLWDVATRRGTVTLTGHTDEVAAVAFSPDGKTLASGSDEEAVRLWNVATGRGITTFTGPAKGLGDVAFSPDGHTLVRGLGDNTVGLWKIR